MTRNAMPGKTAATDLIGAELELIKRNVPGVRGSVAATSDGLLIAHDVHDMEPTQIAALVAALHAVALRATLSTDSGDFRDVITRASEGYLAVFAAGETAIVAVLGTSGLNVAMLNYQARAMIVRVAEIAAGLARAATAEPAYPMPAKEPDGELPVRRRRR